MRKNTLFPISVRFKIGFINSSGDIKVKPKYDGVCFPALYYDYDMMPHPLLDVNESQIIVSRSELDGFMSPNGVELVAPRFPTAGYFSEGLACVRDTNGKWGYVDTTGAWVLPATFDRFQSYSEGFTCVSKKGKYGYLDRNGRWLVPPRFSYGASFSEGFAAVETRGKYGFINTQGDLAIPLKYQSASEFSEGLACVKKDGNYGFIDTSGNWVIDPEFKSADSFSDGRAAVMLDDAEYGYIDPTGKCVIEARYSFAGSFKNGLATVALDWNHKGVIDRRGNSVLPCMFENLHNGFYEGLIYGRELYGTHGYYNTKGARVIELSDEAQLANPFYYGLAALGNPHDYSIQYINKKGEYVWKTQ